MPFVRKTGSQGSQPPTDARKLFIGRTGELLFFVQNILKPEEPSHNIISIWGQGGVGKSTLLARFIDEARSAEFKDYCLAATVDELQTTPASIMEKFADQLHMRGAFSKALKHYRELLRTQQTEQEMLQDSLVQRMPAFAGAAVEGVPFVGPLLGEGVKATAEHLLDRRYKVQRHKDAELLEDPVHALTQAFVDELNQLAETRVVPGSGKVRNRRVILVFDTFEQLADEAAPWLLNYFLPAEIKGNIVLLIAGRDSIERSIPEETKRWLPYCDNETIYWIPLNSFTEDETRAYLHKRDITDPERIATIWHLSQGLPLYLSLLTTNLQGKVDPTKDVVDNFLRWIPQQEHVKRQLALDAALFSRPFYQGDLEAFTYVPEQERPALYRWLIGQPFVRPQDDRYSYHDVARELFRHYLYQHSRKGYYATRRALALHYQRLLEEIQREEGKEVYRSTERFRLILALVSQLLLLPDEASHIKAIEQVLYVLIHRHDTQVFFDQVREMARTFRELSETSTNNTTLQAQQIIKHLRQWFEPSTQSKEDLETYTFILQTVAHEPSFPTKLLALLYRWRGQAYTALQGHRQQAIDDFQRALALIDPTAHTDRGVAYGDLGENQQAIHEFNWAVELDPDDTKAYENRGWTYLYLKEYRRAINDFEHALELDPNLGPAYYERGYVYLWLKDMKQAWADFARSWELYRATRYGWMAEWVSMCQLGVPSNMPERLEELIADAPSTLHSVRYYPRVCREVMHLLHGRYEEAVAELEQAIPLSWEREPWDAYFWKGMACASLHRDEEAMSAVEKALEIELPPILLTPLRWFKQDRPEFYQQYVVPLMARYDLG